MKQYKLTDHAKEEIARRQIPINMLEEVINMPYKITAESSNRKCYQSIFTFPSSKKYLIRAIIKENVGELVVITVYKTSKIGKYIQGEV